MSKIRSKRNPKMITETGKKITIWTVDGSSWMGIVKEISGGLIYICAEGSSQVFIIVADKVVGFSEESL
jgi:hypothetical protein